MMQIIELQAGQQHFSRVKSVALEVGTLACVEPAALDFGFKAVTRATIADKATLRMIAVAAMGRCDACQIDVEMQQRFEACPGCGAFPLHIVAGDQLVLRELEVE